VVNVVEARAIVPTLVRRGVPTADELVEKGARLLAVDDACEGRILSQQADAGVPHHHYQETRLTLG
jgi:hypothetical protein